MPKMAQTIPHYSSFGLTKRPKMFEMILRTLSFFSVVSHGITQQTDRLDPKLSQADTPTKKLLKLGKMKKGQPECFGKPSPNGPLDKELEYVTALNSMYNNICDIYFKNITSNQNNKITLRNWFEQKLGSKASVVEIVEAEIVAAVVEIVAEIVAVVAEMVVVVEIAVEVEIVAVVAEIAEA